MSDNEQIGEEIGRKLSVGAVGFDKPEIQKLVLADQENSHFLVRAVGEARGLKPYQKQAEGDRPASVGYGFIGDFEFTNGVTGQTLNGNIAYFPGFIEDVLASALESGESVAHVAIDIYATYDKESATSYVFSARNLIPQKSKAVEDIKKALPQMPKALPAPKK